MGIKLETKEELLSRVCQEIYDECEQRMRPMYPWVLVRVLPKEHKIGGIWLPENQQNKPIYEGIVLETWQKAGKQSEFKVGDRIAFPSFEGAPHPYLDDKMYRLVREVVNHKDYPNCGIYGWIEYDGDKKIKRELRKLMDGISSITYSGK